MIKKICAVLGPTNTGKTFFAIQQMLKHKNGMIGFPLRLLARENYEKIGRKIGFSKVALLTGEEKIIPSTAIFFFCTVESMPENLAFDFLAIDEVQLASNQERGYFFTDRILNLRGKHLTMFLGSESIEKILRKLFKKIEIIKKPRLSKLNFYGYKNLIRLPPRSAIIAFSQLEVYSIAEKLKKFKGGASIVTGALSPEARNAQVKIFENGEVDYLVATDAIGMGLNLSIKYIFFTNLIKFDGFKKRYLTFDEISQIAGRAGRYKTDGFFGTTQNLKTINPELIKFVEEYKFNPIEKIFWRNSSLNFQSISELIKSIKKKPEKSIFILKKDGHDHMNLNILVQNHDVKKKVNCQKDLKLLWEICGIPDYTKILDEFHSKLLIKISEYMLSSSGYIPSKWFEAQFKQIEKFTDKIENINMKIAQIRIWSFIANKHNWVKDSIRYRDKIKKIEIYLSNRLHKLLVNKFIEITGKNFKSSNFLSKNQFCKLNIKNEVVVNDKVLAILDGFRFKIKHNDSFNLKNSHIYKNLTSSLNRISSDIYEDFINTSFKKITFDMKANIFWKNQLIAKFLKGDKMSNPRIKILHDEIFGRKNLELIKKKLYEFLFDILNKNNDYITQLDNYSKNKQFSPSFRAICFGLYENLGHSLKSEYKRSYEKLNALEINNLKKIKFISGSKFFFINICNHSIFLTTQMLISVYYKIETNVISKKKLILPSMPISDEIYHKLKRLGYYKLKVFNKDYLIHYFLYEKIIRALFFAKKRKVFFPKSIILECNNDTRFLNHCFKYPNALKNF
tara:strand:+ start:29825 stop:32200 length:2376 start_codon:yes stop_codon:yes gene_type:complete